MTRDRGERASIAPDGEARGSGSGAGGSNPGEDYDDDATGGGGDLDSQKKAVENQSSVKPEDYPEPAKG